MSRVVAICAYAGVAASLAMLLVPSLTPGTVTYFLAHTAAWCLASLCLTWQRKHAWESVGIREGPPWRPDWNEPYPAWAFEVAFLIHLVDIPMALWMGYKIFSSTDSLHDAMTLTLNQMPSEVRYGSPLALEHCIFASHFGIFVADFIAQISRPDLMFSVLSLGSWPWRFVRQCLKLDPCLIALGCFGGTSEPTYG
jgi:hypothetical protein